MDQRVVDALDGVVGEVAEDLAEIRELPHRLAHLVGKLAQRRRGAHRRLVLRRLNCACPLELTNLPAQARRLSVALVWRKRRIGRHAGELTL